MAKPPDDTAHWLLAARGGSNEALGQALEACRRYLLQIARQELDAKLQSKGGASDVVQQTFLEAHRDFPRFQGSSEAELLAWLRQILLHNLAKFARRYRTTQKRRVDLEVALQAGTSSGAWECEPAAALPSPSAQMMEVEQAQALEQALRRLPEDYQRVVTLRYREERSFEEIGRLMQRSSNAARKLWARAIERLEQELEPPP